jgi:hypothetical protein
MPSQNMPVQRLKVVILPLYLPCSGIVTASGEILTTVQSQKKRPDGLFPKTTKYRVFQKELYNFEGV